MRNLTLIFLATLATAQLGASQGKIILLLTMPRCVSTAFEASMMARGDLKVYHEPWTSAQLYRTGEPGYFSQEPPEEIKNASTYEALRDLLKEQAKTQNVFVKDMLYGLLPELWEDEAFLADPLVEFTFLIREPGKSIQSFYLKAVDSAEKNHLLAETESSFHYPDMLRLYHRLTELRGEAPAVVDADMLIDNPEGVMANYCQAVGVPVNPDALHWEPGMRSEWKHFAHWHDVAADTHGFKKSNEPVAPRFSKIPDNLKEPFEAIYQKNVAGYSALRGVAINGTTDLHEPPVVTLEPTVPIAIADLVSGVYHRTH